MSAAEILTFSALAITVACLVATIIFSRMTRRNLEAARAAQERALAAQTRADLAKERAKWAAHSESEAPW